VKTPDRDCSGDAVVIAGKEAAGLVSGEAVKDIKKRVDHFQ